MFARETLFEGIGVGDENQLSKRETPILVRVSRFSNRYDRETLLQALRTSQQLSIGGFDSIPPTKMRQRFFIGGNTHFTR